MLRKLFVGALTLTLSITSFTANANFVTTLLGLKPDCKQAVATSDANFCASFKSVAQCNCSVPLPEGMCQDMKTIYDRMLQYTGGTLEKACNYQKDLKPPYSHTDVKTCMNDWLCYTTGYDSDKHPCNPGAKLCERLT